MFLVELPLDVVLEILLVARFDFVSVKFADKFQKRQNDRKGRYIVLHIFEQITKVKIEDEGPKKTQSFKVVS